MTAAANCARESRYFAGMLLTGHPSYFMPANPTQAELVLDMTMAAVALADWLAEYEALVQTPVQPAFAGWRMAAERACAEWRREQMDREISNAALHLR